MYEILELRYESTEWIYYYWIRTYEVLEWMYYGWEKTYYCSEATCISRFFPIWRLYERIGSVILSMDKMKRYEQNPLGVVKSF